MSYTIDSKIGEGGMGCVYKAHDDFGTVVALKMMSNRVASNQDYKEMFNAEVNALRKMHHPRVVGIVGDPYSDTDGNLYLPMEFVEGETLKQVVKSKGPFTEAQAIELMIKIFDGMEHVHRCGNIHRDIKPSNIMLEPDGDIKIIDFGIAKDSKVGSSGHTVGRIIGTDGYMSPEQANGLNIDLRTDVYSLGCVLFFLLTGQNAINKGSNEYETVCAIIDKPFPSVRQFNSMLSVDIDNVIQKATDKNMMTRYQNVGQFRAALQGIGNPNVGEGTKTKMAPGFSSITVGKSADNTIVIDNQYVSRHHLDITCMQANGVYNITITDHSTNGTGIGGKFLKNSTHTLVYDGKSQLPDLMLAGRMECILGWDEVLSHLNVGSAGGSVNDQVTDADFTNTSGTYNANAGNTNAGGATYNANTGNTNAGGSTGENIPVTDDKLGIGLGILSFLFPIVGWVIWGIKKSEKPKMAATAARVAWIGFAVGVVFNLLSKI